MTNPAKEASFYIRRIMEERCTVIASSADHNASIMTAIVDIRDDGNAVVFEYSGAKDLDNLIRQSRSIDFSTCIDDVSITFSSDAVVDTLHQDSPAFKIKMPRSIHRAQRRDYYRATPPLLERPKCFMEYGGITYQAALVDISLGGISIFVQNAVFKPGDIIERCRIVTPVGIELVVVLEIVYSGDELEGSKERQFGCKFRNINGRIESQIQKYVTYLQGRAIAKKQEI